MVQAMRRRSIRDWEQSAIGQVSLSCRTKHRSPVQRRAVPDGRSMAGRTFRILRKIVMKRYPGRRPRPTVRARDPRTVPPGTQSSYSIPFLDSNGVQRSVRWCEIYLRPVQRIHHRRYSRRPRSIHRFSARLQQPAADTQGPLPSRGMQHNPNKALHKPTSLCSSSRLHERRAGEVRTKVPSSAGRRLTPFTVQSPSDFARCPQTLVLTQSRVLQYR
jgi:hypothetical protein